MHKNQLRKTNKIPHILDPQGNLITNPIQIDVVFSNYFSHLFDTFNPSNIEQCLQDMPHKVIEEDNMKLLANFTGKEITKALFMMNPLGAPVLDGFPARFYQMHWSTLGQEVCKFVLNVLTQRCSLDSVNETFITLIPKVKEAKRVEVKLVAKVLANRLKMIMLGIISPIQSAFVPWGYFTNNILIDYETLHSLTKFCHDQNRFMTIKLDMSKAYDRV